MHNRASDEEKLTLFERVASGCETIWLLNSLVVLFFEERSQLLAKTADGLGMQLRFTAFYDSQNFSDHREWLRECEIQYTF